MAQKRSHESLQVYQIKVTLKDFRPPIWRRILVTSDTTLATLHDIIQVAMGWADYHLHQFIIGDHYYGVPDDDYIGLLEMKNEKRYQLCQIVGDERYKFDYEYDFGDSWLHTLLIEKVLPYEQTKSYPVCIKGKRACPPEDVGGVWGYSAFLEAIQNPEHPEHEDYLEWIGGEIDPEAFDMEKINARLRKFHR
jgi:hypothetical protein